MTYEEWLIETARDCKEHDLGQHVFITTKGSLRSMFFKQCDYDHLYMDRFIEDGYGTLYHKSQNSDEVVVMLTDKFMTFMDLVELEE
ncbi:MAG: hypothetical protein QW318_07690 [Candidatus Caldarchaeum sp.]